MKIVQFALNWMLRKSIRTWDTISMLLFYRYKPGVGLLFWFSNNLLGLAFRTHLASLFYIDFLACLFIWPICTFVFTAQLISSSVSVYVYLPSLAHTCIRTVVILQKERSMHGPPISFFVLMFFFATLIICSFVYLYACLFMNLVMVNE